ncbi:carbamate kinase [Virgibacillus kimchii]
MERKRIVVALGGNAIQAGNGTAQSQLKGLEKTAIQLAKLIKDGHELVITHGNGPQVGNIYLQQMQAESADLPAMPLDTCGAMSQGMIGYWLQNAIDLRLKELGVSKPVVSLVTRVEVDAADPAFWNPVKPIGPFYTEKEAEQLMEETGETYVEDANRGWRKVVPSPLPINILEDKSIRTLIESDHIVICAGGGGVPVIHRRGRYIGVEGVIDKDFASRKLAEEINADVLLMLTEVDHAYIHFNTPDEQALHVVGTEEVEELLKEGHFAPGSMLPKVRAGIDFAASGNGRSCIITSLNKAAEALQGKTGTKIVKQAVKQGDASLVSV